MSEDTEGKELVVHADVEVVDRPKWVDEDVVAAAEEDPVDLSCSRALGKPSRR